MRSNRKEGYVPHNVTIMLVKDYNVSTECPPNIKEKL